MVTDDLIRRLLARFDQELARIRDVKQDRLLAGFPKEVLHHVEKIARKRSVTLIEVIRQALETEVYLNKVKDEGGKVFIERGDEMRQLVFKD